MTGRSVLKIHVAVEIGLATAPGVGIGVGVGTVLVQVPVNPQPLFDRLTSAIWPSGSTVTEIVCWPVVGTV